MTTTTAPDQVPSTQTRSSEPTDQCALNQPRDPWQCRHCGRGFVVPSLARDHENTCEAQ